MLPAVAMRHVDHIFDSFEARCAEFVVPSAVHRGYELTVRRIGDSFRPLTKSDLHLLMHSEIKPGTSSVIKNYSTKNHFTAYMSSTIKHPYGPPSPPKTAKAKAKDDWLELPLAPRSRSASPQPTALAAMTYPSRSNSRQEPTNV